MKPFMQSVKDGILVCDGAMGTMIYQKGVYINRCFEALNMQNSELIRDIHNEYLAAGANIIETNTFGGNRIKLAPFGLENDIEAINTKGVEIARSAAKDVAYVAGSVGPLGKSVEPIGTITLDEAANMFREQVEPLVKAGVDVIFLETFRHVNEMRTAMEVVKSLCDLPVVALMTITEDGETVSGVPPENIMRLLTDAGADVVGLNCTIGPKEMLDALVVMNDAGDTPLAAVPNAGFPRIVEGRTLYLTTPEYMAEFARRMIHAADVKIIGGCCGTTPAHTKAIASSVRMLQPALAEEMRPMADLKEAEPEAVCTPVVIEEVSQLAAKLKEGKFVTSIELSPPQGTNVERTMQGVKLCAEHGVDCINIPDGPRASARMNPTALAVLIKQQYEIEPIVHYCCRDRNLLGLQADLLGLSALDLRNLLIITGDPPKLGDYPDATAVFDVDSIGLCKIANRLNHGLDLAERSIDCPAGLFVGVGADPGSLDIEEEMIRFERKVKAGAKVVFTQPVFDLKLFEDFHEAAKSFGIPILVGILPLSSHRNAEFLHNEVPGMHIPKPIRDRMEKVGTGPKAKEEGIAIAREALAACRDLAQGVYVMPPFNNVAAALKVIE